MTGCKLAFLFARGTTMAALLDRLADAFPGSLFYSLEANRELALGDVMSTRPTVLVGILTDVAPDADEMCVFVRAAEDCLLHHEKRCIAVPLVVSCATECAQALERELPEQRVFRSRFTAERIFAVKGWALSLLLPPTAKLQGLNWASFSRDINLYGFSVERVRAALRVPDSPLPSPLSVPDFATFFALSMDHRKAAAAIDLSHLPVVYNGTTEYSVNVSRALVQKPIGDREWTVIAGSAVRTAFDLESWGVQLVAPDEIRQLFDLVFVPHQIYSVAQLKFVAAIALRYAICMLDAIALRCDYLRQDVPARRASSDVAVQYADALLSLSNAGADDVRTYYESEGLQIQIAPILITKNVRQGPSLRGARYALVIGNRFHHKAVSLFLNSFIANPPDIGLKVIADEATQARYRGTRNVDFLESGDIPEERMSSLYDSAAVIVFPSLYEGFGLPILGGLLRGKPILAIDTQVNRELKHAFDKHDLLTLLSSHSGIVDFLRAAGPELTDVRLRQHFHSGPVRTWDEVARDTHMVLEQACSEPIAWTRLFSRMRDVRNLVDAAAVQDASLLRLSLRRLNALLPKGVSKFLRQASLPKIQPSGR